MRDPSNGIKYAHDGRGREEWRREERRSGEEYTIHLWITAL
jgi:hypothetical protein